ncbi:hypothetical protein [Deinococcus apachensis]|uniref:hypothetical protein n=1 Tax=Deinococcus apachensis TaxID=309886 RepID=UPI0012F72B5E|nr:hypothetical protein [Deinococcus apachensis]
MGPPVRWALSCRWVLPAAVLWVLFTFGPPLGVLLASAVADAHSCRPDESGAYPCVVAG